MNSESEVSIICSGPINAYMVLLKKTIGYHGEYANIFTKDKGACGTLDLIYLLINTLKMVYDCTGATDAMQNRDRGH